MAKRKAKAEVTETVVEEAKAPETNEVVETENVETETSAEVEVNVPESENELVMEASVIPESLKKAPEYIPSTYVILTNTSQNRLSLVGEGVKIDIAPREIKRDVKREDLKVLLKNKVIRNWFDKGILSSNMDAESQSPHEAVAPKNLTSAVERHDNGMNIEASVKKFEPAGTVDINLL